VRHADPNNRTFNYAMIGGARVLGASAWRLVLVKFLAAMNPAADVLALASLEVDIGKLSPGDAMTVKWRGKPVFIRHRPESEIEAANAVAMAELRDPEADSDRAQRPEHLVVLGVCTHLGCVPIGNAGDFGGWFCPCHGSHYDTSGRIRKGPAPLNLEVPPYSYLEDDKLLIG
jgi:ubiquinol-cytochrome c reductase iron-sulfur subunit